jgi:GT2 family glycosyltransferase
MDSNDGPTLASDVRAGGLATTPVTVSVVICCYTERRWDDIIAAVESVRRQTAPAQQVLVVVDHCPELLRRLRDELDTETVLENTYPRGLSGGRNSGVAAAAGEIVAFLDDDAVAAPDWLEHMVAEYADDRVMAVGGRTEPSWDEPAPVWFPEEFGWVVGSSYRGLPTQRAAIRNPLGCNMSIRRDVLAEVGEFREGVGRAGGRPLGCEETELCIRAHARRPDDEIVYQPRSVIRHRVPAERGTLSYFRSRCYAEGLSKAAVARIADSGRALSTERSYIATALRRGVTDGLRDGLSGRDRRGFGRAGAIVAGLGVTCWGYAVGHVSLALQNAARRMRPRTPAV